MIKEKITLNYLNKVDKELRLIPLTKDFMFKSVMQRNVDILEKFLVDLMHLKIDKDDSIIFLDKELIKGRIKEKGRIVDIKIKFGKKYLIQIEVNGKRYQTVKIRNDLYLERIDTLRLETNDHCIEEFDTEYLYQLNLNASKEEDESVGLSSLVEYDRINKVITSDRIEKYSANLVYYRNLYYNESKEMSFSDIFMAGLTSKNFTELYHIMSKILSEKEVSKLIEDVINMTNEELLYNIHYWEKEKMDALVEHNVKEDAKKAGLAEGLAEGHEKGLAEGHEKGLAEGSELAIKEVIKNMLKENINYEYISKITGKKLEEIKKIEIELNKL